MLLIFWGDNHHHQKKNQSIFTSFLSSIQFSFQDEIMIKKEPRSASKSSSANQLLDYPSSKENKKKSAIIQPISYPQTTNSKRTKKRSSRRDELVLQKSQQLSSKSSIHNENKNQQQQNLNQRLDNINQEKKMMSEIIKEDEFDCDLKVGEPFEKIESDLRRKQNEEGGDVDSENEEESELLLEDCELSRKLNGDLLVKHVGVIMDGNRRFGIQEKGDKLKGCVIVVLLRCFFRMSQSLKN